MSALVALPYLCCWCLESSKAPESDSIVELAAMNRRFGEYFLAASPADDAIRQSRIIRRNGGWMVQAMYLSMGTQHDYRPALTQITAPALVVHGERDILPEESAAFMPRGSTPRNLLFSGRQRRAAWPVPTTLRSQTTLRHSRKPLGRFSIP